MAYVQVNTEIICQWAMVLYRTILKINDFIHGNREVFNWTVFDLKLLKHAEAIL